MEKGKDISLGDIGKFRSVTPNLSKDEYKLYAPFQMRRHAKLAKGWGQIVTPLPAAENHFPQLVKMVRIGTQGIHKRKRIEKSQQILNAEEVGV